MQQVVWKLDDYYIEQYQENPQLFETNLHEIFPGYKDYTVTTDKQGTYATIYLNLH